MKSVGYHGYTIYEDGTIIGLYGSEITKRNNKGRWEIRLNIENKRRNFIVSRLVYYVFKPFDMKNRDLCVSYRDGDPLNIHLDNLFLAHRRDLIQGDKHVGRAKLTNKQVEEIRELYKGRSGTSQHDKVGYSLNDLAIKYGVTKSNIAVIIKGRSRNKEEYKL